VLNFLERNFKGSRLSIKFNRRGHGKFTFFDQYSHYFLKIQDVDIVTKEYE